MVCPHTHTLGATQEGLTAETIESPKVDTLKNSDLGYYWVLEAAEQGVVSSSSLP